MSDANDKAMSNFSGGFNCAQAVLSAFCEKYNMKEEDALRIASGLGSGCRAGELCGAASGAVLVIGLKYGQNKANDIDSKKNCNTKTEEFIQAFRKANGSIVCKEILDCDIMTESGREKAISNNLFTTLCKEKVSSAARILEGLGY